MSAANPRSRLAFAVLTGGLVLLCAAFVALGVWQLERRVWKLALIASVDARVHAPASPVPGPERWAAIRRDGDTVSYAHVSAEGRFLNDRTTLVQAVTVAGAGHWLMTPFVTTRGFTLLVDRGFVAGRSAPPLPGERRVTGLLRLDEPGGGFLQANDPARDAWHSRDVAAIAKARGLGAVAPYFIDADAASAGPGVVGGLTVIRFHNSHLIYAVTWFSLAVLSGYALVVAIRRRRLSR